MMPIDPPRLAKLDLTTWKKSYLVIESIAGSAYDLQEFRASEPKCRQFCARNQRLQGEYHVELKIRRAQIAQVEWEVHALGINCFLDDKSGVHG